MPLSNDERGWIMTGLSGIGMLQWRRTNRMGLADFSIACVFGASFICIDILVRQFPGKKDWRIQDSDVFLSISLSLSFGVMLFSALYSMLPSAKSSLIKGGYDSKTASWILIGCFLGGVIGIQIISRVMHHYVPHNVVDCEHHHDDEEDQKEVEGHHHEDHDHHDHHDHHGHLESEPRQTLRKQTSHRGYAQRPEATQRLSSQRSFLNDYVGSNTSTVNSKRTATATQQGEERRPTLHSRLTEVATKLTSGKDQSCECDGPCYGFSDVCQTACFKTVNARGGFKAPKLSNGSLRPGAAKRATATESTPLLAGADEPLPARPHTRAAAEGCSNTLQELDPVEAPSDDSSATAFADDNTPKNQLHKSHSHASHSSHDQQQPTHHHHVPTNAFLNIGLQTSIAIALHKLPEGFITYATNHANPSLGVSVFLALFIHNITEGFAMALPLYLAINNRLKAMLVSFVLGGLSQPLGAAVAAVWFKLAGQSQWAPSESGYGAMFAVTAGIMASVALQLFAESLDLTHSKHLCMIGAFAGMAILGMSSALTA